MLVGFKKVYAPKIVAGSKTQTIRQERKDKRLPKKNETLHMYTGLRTAYCKKLGVATCLGTAPIVLDGPRIIVDGNELDPEMAEAFARADGFYGLTSFVDFFDKQYKIRTHSLYGFVYYWSGFLKDPRYKLVAESRFATEGETENG